MSKQHHHHHGHNHKNHHHHLDRNVKATDRASSDEDKETCLEDRTTENCFMGQL